MGDSRARSKGTGGAALPMTRRQQKRARQRPQPARRASQSPKRLTAPAVAAPVGELSAQKAGEPAKSSSRAARPARSASRMQEAPAARSSVRVVDADPSSNTARKKTLRPATRASLAVPKASARLDVAEPTLATEPAPQTKKFPTLAKIAVAPRSAPADEQPAEAETAHPDASPQEPAAILDDQTPAHAFDLDAQSREAGDTAETRPVRARRPSVTRRLQATRDDAAITSLRQEAHEREAQSHESATTRRTSRTRPHPLAEIDLTLPVAGAHAAVAAVAALAGAALLVQGASGAVWPLMLTAIAGIGGWLAYVLGQQKRTRGVAGIVLTLSQVGILVWVMLVIGPRGSLIALTPAIALLALRMSGLLVAIAGSALAVGSYLALSLQSAAHHLQPVIRLSVSPGIAVDVVVVSFGLFIALLALDLWHRQHVRLDQQARARLREARALRSHGAQDRRRLDVDLQLVEDALAEALRGQGISRLNAGPEFDALAERVALVAERLRTLQRDREDRLRIEGALRGLIREVERAWLGLPWTWPAPSGTTLDELIALLRAPRSHETPASWPDETPTLVPIPSAISQPSRPWDVVTPNELAWTSRPRDLLYSQLPLGLDESDAGHAVPARVSQPPWQEWDVWRDWDPNQSRVVGE